MDTCNTVAISGGSISNEQYTGPNVTTSVGENNNQNKTANSASGLEKQLISTIEKANHLQTGTTECQFSIHEETKQIMIKIVDSTTKEVLKEIPAEKILDMFATMCEAAGLFVDEKR